MNRSGGAVGQGGGNVVEKTELCTKCMIKKSLLDLLVQQVYQQGKPSWKGKTLHKK